MSRAVDANLLLYASDAASSRYERARTVVEQARLRSGVGLSLLAGEWRSLSPELILSLYPRT